MIVSITGSTGNMGLAVLKELCTLPEITSIKLLVRSNKKVIKLQKLLNKIKGNVKVEYILGDMNSSKAIEELTNNTNYVINMAAVIPPHSDKNIKAAINCNEIGVKNLIQACENSSSKPKLIHISTVAVYGNRSLANAYGRVGDPLIPTPFDIYSLTKIRSEYAVLESNIESFLILRQTAMYHTNMLKDNMKDGLMFHTRFDAPLEWVTAHDSGILIAKLLHEDYEHKLNKNFWNKVYNIGGGKQNQLLGYEVFDKGFKLMGASVKDFFAPNYTITRNFHGVWFKDGDVLENLFHYQTESSDFYWEQMHKKYWYYELGRIIPKKFLKKIVIDKVRKNDSSSPYYWYLRNDESRMVAYFKGSEEFDKIPKTWKQYKLPDKKQVTINNLNYGYDIEKPLSEISLEDLRNVALLHGGRLISNAFSKGDIYKKLMWEDQDGNTFIARPYTILGAGHWVTSSYKNLIWDYDRLAKKDKIIDQLWYDSHSKDENYVYKFDQDLKAYIEVSK